MSKLPRHTAIASCQPRQSTKMSVLSHRQIRHQARRRQLQSHPRQLPSHPRRLLLTLQSPQLFQQRFLPSHRCRPHRRLCGLRKCYGCTSPLGWPSRGWLLSHTRNGNRKRSLQGRSRFIRIRIGTLRRSPQRMCPSNTGYIFIPMYLPARTGSRLTEQARF